MGARPRAFGNNTYEPRYTRLLHASLTKESLPIRLPAHADVSTERIAAAARHHGLPSHPITRLPDTGIFNAIYLLGTTAIMRIPRQHPAHYHALYNESIAVPLARHVGVCTPDLLVHDDTRTLLPVPYTIYERVQGETLSGLDLEPGETPEVWRELGRDLSRLHVGIEREGLGVALDDQATLPDPRELATTLATGGWITASESRWLTHWLDRIAPAALTPVQPRLLHSFSLRSSLSSATRSPTTPGPSIH